VTPRREDRAQAKRAAILAAARALFQERGFAGTPTDAVVARAGVSKETLYRYYPSKDRLLVAVMQDMAVEGVLSAPPTPLPDGAGHEELVAALSALAGAILDRMLAPEYLALARLVLAESGRCPDLADTFRRAVPDTGAAGIRRVLADAQQRGLLRPDVDLAAAGHQFVSPLLAWGLSALIGGDFRRPTPADVQTAIRLFLDGASARRP
jgi:TetR/AcrR family transcriptional regulator, mexJK operon transcriptional repressor